MGGFLGVIKCLLSLRGSRSGQCIEVTYASLNAFASTKNLINSNYLLKNFDMKVMRYVAWKVNYKLKRT